MISSTANRLVVDTAKLRKRALRDDRRRFLVEGAQPCAEAVEAGVVDTLFHTPDEGSHDVARAAQRAGVRIVSVSEQVMAHLTSTVTPQGLLAVARFVDMPLDALPAGAGLVPVLCAARDPGNAGTVLRSADAAGADALVFAGTSVDVYNPKTVRASAGSLFHVPVVKGVSVGDAVAEVRRRGMQVLAAEAGGERSVYEADLSVPTAILFGNEAWGLPPDARGLADGGIRVPIRGRAQSLNLAAAAALIMFEAARQRGTAVDGADGLGPAISASAHDIRTSLTALKGFAGMLVSRWDRLTDVQRREMVKGMTVDAERTSTLVKMVVDGARLEAGAFRPSPERLPVEDAAAWVVGVFGRSDDYPNVTVEGSAVTLMDPDRLQGLLFTLADAAMSWGGDGPVRLVVAEQDGIPVVEVARAGAEFDAEGIEACFEPPRPGGPGRFGLWLARRLAEAQGGSVSCEQGSGSLFRLALPAVPSA